MDKLFIASSSSIYGNLGSIKPVTEEDATGVNLKSFYAETKWQNELDAMKFSRSSHIRIIATRFFTVYGPYGRPDMAYWKFAQQIEQGEEISLYGKEGGSRNYTFVDDVVIILIALLAVDIDPGFMALNVAAGSPITTKIFAEKLGLVMGKSVSNFNTVVRPDSDVEKTWANTSFLHDLIGDLPKTTLDDGLRKFAQWYMSQDKELRSYKPL
jgi:UDP-glucuronate 4-epimerase